MEAVSGKALERKGQAPEGKAGKKGGISGSTVKIIAVAAMLIDHIGAVVLMREVIARNYPMAYWGGESQLTAWMAQNGMLFYTYEIMRHIGRLGFPIFCFLLVEGFQRTRNVGKYALRLGIFALISEIPFNLALAGGITEPGYQNVYFTLLLGLAALWLFRFFREKILEKRNPEKKRFYSILQAAALITGVLFPGVYCGLWLGVTYFSHSSGDIMDYLSGSKYFSARFEILCAVSCLAILSVLFFYGRKKGMAWIYTACADMTVLAALMFLAEVLCTDYAGMGVLTIAVMYGMRKNRMGSIAAGCIVLTIMSFNEIFAFIALIPVALYNGRRGLRMKYFFYAFYPVHLLLLYLIVLWMGLGNIRVI